MVGSGRPHISYIRMVQDHSFSLPHPFQGVSSAELCNYPPSHPTTFRANSHTASCIPKHTPAENKTNTIFCIIRAISRTCQQTRSRRDPECARTAEMTVCTWKWFTPVWLTLNIWAFIHQLSPQLMMHLRSPLEHFFFFFFKSESPVTTAYLQPHLFPRTSF